MGTISNLKGVIHAICVILPLGGVFHPRVWILHLTMSFATDLPVRLSIHHNSMNLDSLKFLNIELEEKVQKMGWLAEKEQNISLQALVHQQFDPQLGIHM